MPRKPTLSPTKIATYLTCALKYRYVYVDRIGRFYQRARAGFSFGSTLHGVLEEFHSGGEQADAAQMLVTYEKKWISAGYESAEHEREHKATGAQIVAAYHAAAVERVELGVKTLLTEKQISADMGEFNLIGRVDRVDEHPDGTLEVVDYKSGRQQTEQVELDGNLAMSVYQLILMTAHPGRRVIASIYSLRTGHKATTELGERAGPFREEIMRLGHETLFREFDELRPVRIPACDDCDFLPRCSGYWREE